MPKISRKGISMPESPIRKLVPYSEEAKSRGIKVYHLNIGQPDILTPDIAIEAIKNTDIKVVEYSHSAGNISYRKKLVKFYKDREIDITENEVMVTTGGSEALLFTFLSCMDEGDEVIIPEPFYANYNGFTTAAGVKIVPVTSYIENDFALPPIEEFEKAITTKTKGILVSHPNNPTGYLYSKKELEKLSEIVKKHDLYLISDEVYRDFSYTDEPYFSTMQLKGLEEHTILIDSVSKRFSSCGMRIGTLITKNKKILETVLKFAQARLSPPSFGQIAAEAALDTPQEYFNAVYKEYIARRNYTVERLNKIKGLLCPNPRGAFYTIVRLPVNDSDDFARWLLSDFEYKRQTIMVAPGSGFYSTPGLGKDEMRIAYVLKIDDLIPAYNCLEEALRIYPGKTI